MSKIGVIFNNKFIVLVLLLVTGSVMYAQSQITLDKAIQNFGKEIEEVLKQDVSVAILNFDSKSETFTNYMIQELMTALNRGKKVTLVEREKLDLVLKELNLHMSGYVDDNTAQGIGKLTGAESIVTGSIDDIGRYYRIRFKTIEVVSGNIQVLSAENVQKDKRVAFLMGEAQKENNGWTGSLGYGALNIVLGLGSYLQGDTKGGLIVTAGYAISLGFVVWDLAGLNYDDPMAGIPGTIGIGLAGATTIFGFVKPFFYYKNNKLSAVFNKINIAPVSGKENGNRMIISYTFSF
jgi:TolB-like protein